MSADVLRVLPRLGIDREHPRVLVLLPLVEVAWADGEVQPAEEALLRRIAKAACPDEGEQMLLEDWLRHPPSPACLHHARAALSFFAHQPHPELPPALIARLPRLARKVAAADSGWFGLKISPEEQLALQRLSDALADGTLPAPQAHPDLERTMPCVTLIEEFGPERDPHPAVLIPERAGHRRERLYGEGTMLGSASSAQCCVRGDGEVAACHGQLLREGESWRVRAQEGPVWVNGERIQYRRLQGGELVRLSARTAFWFKRLRPAPPPPSREERRVRVVSR
jgi:hypothetical protein